MEAPKMGRKNVNNSAMSNLLKFGIGWYIMGFVTLWLLSENDWWDGRP